MAAAVKSIIHLVMYRKRGPYSDSKKLSRRIEIREIADLSVLIRNVVSKKPQKSPHLLHYKCTYCF